MDYRSIDSDDVQAWGLKKEWGFMYFMKTHWLSIMFSIGISLVFFLSLINI